jgi:hypothetical protein
MTGGSAALLRYAAATGIAVRTGERAKILDEARRIYG